MNGEITSVTREKIIFGLVDEFMKFKNEDLSNSTFKEMLERWNKTIGFFSPIKYRSGINTIGHYFRATKSDWHSVIPIEWISYPPKDSCIRNRCNWDNPVLYTSTHPTTTLYECNAREGDGFFISSWKTTDSTQLITYPFLSNYYGDKKDLIKIKETYFESIKDLCLKKNLDYEIICLVIKLITDSFLDSSHFISSFISHYILFHETRDKINTILYPSIQLKKREVNVAFHHRLIDDGIIEPDKVVFCKVLEIRNRIIGYHVTDFLGEIKEGKIYFSKSNEDELKKTEFAPLYGQHFELLN